jgi:hypothetical protein
MILQRTREVAGTEPFPPVALSTLMGFGLSFGFLATATANGPVFSQQSLCPQGG